MYLRDRITNHFHYSQFVDELLGNNYSLLPGNDNTAISLGHGLKEMEWFGVWFSGLPNRTNQYVLFQLS